MKLLRLRSDTLNSFFLNVCERIACSGPASKRGRKFVDLRSVSTNLPADELPEAPYILPQVAHHEIGSISAEIFFSGCFLPRHNPPAPGTAADHRPFGDLIDLFPTPTHNPTNLRRVTSLHI